MTITLMNCQAVVIPDPNPPTSGDVKLSAGGLAGTGYVTFTASDANGTQIMNVPTGGSGSLWVDQMTLLTAHYYKDPKYPDAPEDIEIEVDLP